MENTKLNEIINDAVASVTETKEAQTYVGKTESGKTYSTKAKKGFSLKQLNFLYGRAKTTKAFYVAENVYAQLKSWADRYEPEAQPEMEDLRQAACKAIICCGFENYAATKMKLRYIESRLRAMSKAA